MCSIDGIFERVIPRANAITAYRVCKVREAHGRQPLRLAPQYDSRRCANPWATPRRIVRAHAVPKLYNRVGLYARKNRLHASNQAWDNEDVLVRVKLWGRIVEGTNGYRAQYMQIMGIGPIGREFFGPDITIIRELVQRYGVTLLRHRKPKPIVVMDEASPVPSTPTFA